MPRALKPLGVKGIQGRFWDRYEAVTGRLWMPQVALLAPSDAASEEYDFAGHPPSMREWIGRRQKRELRPYKITVPNKKYEATLEVSEDDLRRDKTAQVRARISEMGTGSATLPQKVVSDLILANGTAYDGKALYANDHQVGDSKTMDNLLAFNAVDPAKPTTAEMTDIIIEIIANLLDMENDAGEAMNEFMQSILVMVPLAHYAPAIGALKNLFTSAGVSNTLQSVIDNDDFQIDVKWNRKITANDVYGFRTDSEVKAMIWQDEVDTELRTLGENSSEYFWEDVHTFGAKRIGGGGYGYFQMTNRTQVT